MKAVLPLILALALALPACDPEIDLGGDYHVVLDLAPTTTSRVDLVFVVDDSPAMADRLAQAVADAPDLLTELTGYDLHIGVALAQNGDGKLVSDGCPKLANPWIDGTNAGDSACLLGRDADDTSRPRTIAALVDAANGRNPNFLRDDALFAAVVLTDADDCSYLDANAANSAWSCFQQGVACDGPTPNGVFTHCHADDRATTMRSVTQLARSLRAARPAGVAIAVIDGSDASIQRLDCEAGPELVNACPPFFGGLPMCDDPARYAAPAIRLADFSTDLDGRAWPASVCPDDFFNAMTGAARFIARTAQASRCLNGPVHDSSFATPGVQPACRVWFDRAGTRTRVDSCSVDPTAPCFRFIDDEACLDTETGLSLFLSSAPPSDAHVIVECL